MASYKRINRQECMRGSADPVYHKDASGRVQPQPAKRPISKGVKSPYRRGSIPPGRQSGLHCV